MNFGLGGWKHVGLTLRRQLNRLVEHHGFKPTGLWEMPPAFSIPSPRGHLWRRLDGQSRRGKRRGLSGREDAWPGRPQRTGRAATPTGAYCGQTDPRHLSPVSQTLRRDRANNLHPLARTRGLFQGRSTYVTLARDPRSTRELLPAVGRKKDGNPTAIGVGLMRILVDSLIEGDRRSPNGRNHQRIPAFTPRPWPSDAARRRSSGEPAQAGETPTRTGGPARRPRRW